MVITSGLFTSRVKKNGTSEAKVKTVYGSWNKTALGSFNGSQELKQAGAFKEVLSIKEKALALHWKPKKVHKMSHSPAKTWINVMSRQSDSESQEASL